MIDLTDTELGHLTNLTFQMWAVADEPDLKKEATVLYEKLREEQRRRFAARKDQE